MTKNKIYFVEDDLPFGSVLKSFLELNDYIVEWHSDGEEGLKKFKAGIHNLVILDVMLPHTDGFTIAEHIRSLDEGIPLIFLTAKTMKEDILKGYKTGADDYITKPFDTEVLLVKIEALLKRRTSESPHIRNSSLNIGTVQLDVLRRELTFGNTKTRLSPRECELLQLLYENKNRLVSRSEILNKLWGADDYFSGRSMDVFIARIRKCLSADENIELQSIPRSGYILLISEEI